MNNVLFGALSFSLQKKFVKMVNLGSQGGSPVENRSLFYCERKYLQIIGLATYPLYLIHQRLGSMIIELYTDFGVIDIYSVFITMALVLVAIYIGIIDKDLRKFIKNKFIKN